MLPTEQYIDVVHSSVTVGSSSGRRQTDGIHNVDFSEVTGWHNERADISGCWSWQNDRNSSKELSPSRTSDMYTRTPTYVRIRPCIDHVYRMRWRQRRRTSYYDVVNPGIYRRTHAARPGLFPLSTGRRHAVGRGGVGRRKKVGSGGSTTWADPEKCGTWIRIELKC